MWTGFRAVASLLECAADPVIVLKDARATATKSSDLALVRSVVDPLVKAYELLKSSVTSSR